MTQQNKEDTLQQTLENEREYTPQEVKERNAKTMKLFVVFMAVVVSLIILLVVLGLLFGG